MYLVRASHMDCGLTVLCARQFAFQFVKVNHKQHLQKWNEQSIADYDW